MTETINEAYLVKASVTHSQKREWSYPKYKTGMDAEGKMVRIRVGTGYYRQSAATMENPGKKSLVFVDVAGESIFQDFMYRADRPHAEWKPLVIKALKDAGIEFESLRWSQKAGCSCGCSPAFIVTGNTGHNIWVKLEVDAPQTTDLENAEWRGAQLAAQL